MAVAMLACAPSALAVQAEQECKVDENGQKVCTQVTTPPPDPPEISRPIEIVGTRPQEELATVTIIGTRPDLAASYEYERLLKA